MSTARNVLKLLTASHLMTTNLTNPSDVSLNYQKLLLDLIVMSGSLVAGYLLASYHLNDTKTNQTDLKQPTSAPREKIKICMPRQKYLSVEDIFKGNCLSDYSIELNKKSQWSYRRCV